MKKYIWIFFLVIIMIGIAIIAYHYLSQNMVESNYEARKTAIESTGKQMMLNDIDLSTKERNNEVTISNYETKLPKDTKARYSNINLACQTLNGTIIKAGSTFSLWNVLGCPTPEKGYRKAKTFTSGGKVKQSYGGGICQVSTTIYNAVMEVKGLTNSEVEVRKE